MKSFLRFVTPGGVYQFKALGFGLTTSPQVFTRAMAPVSVMLHSMGVRMLRHLDDSLVQASSRLGCVQARDKVLTLCQVVGNYHQSGEISTPPFSDHNVLGDSPRLPDFEGFSVADQNFDPVVVGRQISVLQSSARVYLEAAHRSHLLPDSGGPRKLPMDGSPPVGSQEHGIASGGSISA